MVSNNSNGSAGPVRTPRLRLAGFVIAVLIGGLAIAWINTSVRQRMKALERDFADIKTERFYQGVHVRQGIRRLNELLLEYQVTGERLPLVRFRTESEELRVWVDHRLRESPGAEERLLQLQLADALQQYLAKSLELQERHGFLVPARRRIDATNERLEAISGPLLTLCDLLTEKQRGTFAAFLDSSQVTLDSFQQWIKISLLFLLVLAVAVAVLVYRGMIAPLQVELSESHAIIARQEKLAALGGLAAGVAHEIRNPLTAIKFRLFSLRKSLPAELVDNEDANVIAGEISRLERIVRDFLEFARPSEPEPANVSARQLLDEVSNLMRPQLEEAGVTLKVADSDGIWLHVDFQQIKQVLINLIRNAAESMDEKGGTVTLRAYTDAAPITGRKIAVSAIEVIDNGRGIPPEVSRRLFDPFFTTKAGGTGLGLSIAARIVEKHGGELQYESQPDRGTTFRLVLPTPIPDESANTDR